MANSPFDPALIRDFHHHLSVICRSSEFLLATVPEGEMRADLVEIRKASLAALDLLPQLTPPGRGHDGSG